MTNATFVLVFCSFYETRVENNNKCALSLSFVFFSYIATDNDEPPHSSLSFATQEKNKKKNIETQKKMTSLPTHHCPLQPKNKKLDVGFLGLQEMILAHHCLLAFFFFFTCRR